MKLGQKAVLMQLSLGMPGKVRTDDGRKAAKVEAEKILAKLNAYKL